MLGIDRPFVMNVGGLDPRKNTWKLIEAFAALPEGLRDSHQLVLTFATDEWGRGHVLNHAREFGVEDSVVVTGEVTDETLTVLYQRCAAFAFPSHYEGFGLPILEAMHCGAAVIVGNNSSQVEIVGDAGLLANAGDAHDITDKIASLLDDPGHARVLGDRAVERAATYSWEAVSKMRSKGSGSWAAPEGRPAASGSTGGTPGSPRSPSSRPCRRGSRGFPTTPTSCSTSCGSRTGSTSSTTPATSPSRR